MSLSLARRRRNNDASGLENETVPSKKRSCSQKKVLSQVNRTTQSQRLHEDGLEDTRRCGKLLRMHLTNFMCHSNLSIDFHSRINFLVGSNGSGKSAMLAALVLGLGGSAKTTNRSRNAKGFIKTGEHTAKIEIVLANDGPQPYEPQEYGDKITVVRTISTTTSGSYVLKNANGQVVSKKLDDLHRLLMYHNVQVDNPVFVLNQDSAREFLKDLEPSKNYKLFLKATQVDTVMDKLNDCLHLHRAHVTELQSLKSNLQKQAKVIEEHKGQLKELLSFEKLKDVLKETETQYHWLLVRQCEDDLHTVNEAIDKFEMKKKELKNSIENKNELNMTINQEIKQNATLIVTNTNNYDAEAKLCRKIKGKVEEMSRLSVDIQSAIDSLQKKKSLLQTEISDIKLYVEERANGSQGEVEAQRKDDHKLIAEYRDQCNSHLDPMIENVKKELRMQIDNKSQKERVVHEIKCKQRECLDEIRLTCGKIATVKASVQNKLLIFGSYMPQLLKIIDKVHSEGRFSKLPRGPIGNYVEVPNGEFRDVVENILGAGLLGAFLVNNSKDRQILEQIMASFCPKFPIIITSAFADSVYDVSRGSVCPPSGTRLLMHEIKCCDPVVLNCLIDCAQIETILLTDNKQIAEQITSVHRNVPRNLSKVLALNQTNMALEYHPMPKYRMYSTKFRHASVIQGCNLKDRIRELESEKLSLENKLQALEADLNHIGQQVPQDSKLIHEKRMLLEKYESSKKELLEKIVELENVEYADYSNEFYLLKTEMEETEGRFTDVEKALTDKRAKLANSNIEKDRFEQELITKENDLLEIRNEIEIYQTKVDQLNVKLRSINSNDSINRAKSEEIEEAIKNLLGEQQGITHKLEKYTAAASQKGERGHTKLSVKEIQDKISNIKAKLKHGKPVSVDPQSLLELIAAKEDALEASQDNYDDIKSSIDSFRKSLKFRFDFLKKLKEHMALVLQLSFSMILKFRDFEGSLNVNHHDRTLSVSVVPRDHNKDAVSGTKSLSGGERSYSTVAFLISLWSCVDHPFYFLDEYDVFTDEVNRDYMTRLLVEEGRKRPLRQYSFLTPQELSLMSENFIKIQRLSEPDRS